MVKLAVTYIAVKITKAPELHFKQCFSIFFPAACGKLMNFISWVLAPPFLNLRYLFLSSSTQILWFYTLYLVSDIIRVPMLETNPLAATILGACPHTTHLRGKLEAFLLFVYCLSFRIRKSVWVVIMLYPPVPCSLVSTGKLSQTYDAFTV